MPLNSIFIYIAIYHNYVLPIELLCKMATEGQYDLSCSFNWNIIAYFFLFFFFFFLEKLFKFIQEQQHPNVNKLPLCLNPQASALTKMQR